MGDKQNDIGHYLFFGAITLVGVVSAAFVMFSGQSESADQPRVVINLEAETPTFPVSDPSKRPLTSRVVDPAKLRSGQSEGTALTETPALAFFLAPADTALGELDGGSLASWRPIDLNLNHIAAAKTFELDSDQLINLVLTEEGALRLGQLSSENNLRDQGKRAEMVIAMLDGRVISSTTFKRPTDSGNLVLSTDLSKSEQVKITNRINQLCGSF